jgi:gliding motility-associated-like protein
LKLFPKEMMKRLLFISLFFLSLLPVRATHIVGGELQLKYITGSTYQVTLNMYFDNINGNRAAIDPAITVSIFEQGTHTRMANILVTNLQVSRVPYTTIACSSGSLSTDKIVYTQNISLSPQIYTSPKGYYLVWERCCRNGVISNILSPGAAGQAFYLEFPAVIQNGRSFYNSSPELFQPISDYACLNEVFQYDFGGKDPDGDSLVYEMATPLNGHSNITNPAPLTAAGPYSLVQWTAGLNTASQIPGSPTLTVDPGTGRLQVRPNRLGLFVFGIRCSEYRGRVKIGEVRRDFQLLVINCPRNAPPQVLVKVAGQPGYYQEGDTLLIRPADDRCLELLLTDTDPDEALIVESKPVNFTGNTPFLSLTSGIVNRNGIRDTLRTRACFQPCFDTQGKVYTMDFIVSDDGCSLPKKDTIRVSFQVVPRPDQKPVITTTAAAAILKPRIGDVIAFDVTGTDADNDLVRLALTGQNFALSGQAISFPAASGTGTATSHFTWKIDCQAVQQPSYVLKFQATTMVCGLPVSDSILIEVQPQYANAPPAIASAMAGKTIDIVFGTAFSDSIFATDGDMDLIHLTAAGEGFNLADYGMTCLPASGHGATRARFSWQPTCLIQDKEEFTVKFSVAEETCRPDAPPPLSVTFRVAYEAAAAFLPANIFTPNNDGLNDYFEIPNLPADLCLSLFSSIKIYNRWGGLVYESSDRRFKWNGAQAVDGVYFYVITYSDKQFRGTVTKLH